ncbi:hypothetical protein M378DRAFT_9513 [Amanita muscaria Koide BX008]|uniref:Uncharacterized protein n=1 Tax=Amanita muscaria (strain Koide BX008) TaxID=946122 RepID=A0A0C2WZK6_AMAMK|nr:hypothetical protein M378DRAFT_9513 [Amanita muscaria Koide BX008]
MPLPDFHVVQGLLAELESDVKLAVGFNQPSYQLFLGDFGIIPQSLSNANAAFFLDSNVIGMDE